MIYLYILQLIILRHRESKIFAYETKGEGINHWKKFTQGRKK